MIKTCGEVESKGGDKGEAGIEARGAAAVWARRKRLAAVYKFVT